MKQLRALLINRCGNINETRAIRPILRDLGILPVIPSKNKEILNFLDSSDFDIIIIHSDAFGANDIAAVEMIRIHETAKGRNTPILFSLILKAEEENIEKIIKVGANDYINGPANKKLWRAVLGKIFN